MKLVLVATPWQLFNRPSIQLGALKAFMQKEVPGIEVRALHPYLSYAAQLGFSDYHTISQSSWASEAIGASLLRRENLDDCRKFFCKALLSRGDGKRAVAELSALFDRARKLLEKHLLDFVENLDVRQVKLAGFTACLNQFSASIYAARLFRERFPQIPIVIGGTSCSGSIAPSILKAYRHIDYIISGEGELPLLSLWKHVTSADAVEGQETLPSAVFFRKSLESACENLCYPQENRHNKGKMQLASLDELPYPDYDDYFRELAELPAQMQFYPVLPVESSRGCWWGRCRFCNLNLQWKGYRAASTGRVAAMIDSLSRRYRCIDFAFMDNVLPRRQAAALFDTLSTHRRDYSIFAELRAVHSRDEYARMACGGLTTLQVGIEALSDSLLRRLGKGASVISNIAAMRHAFEAGVELDGNLIVHFPGSTDTEVQETLKILDFVWPYRPLRTVSFWLGHGSPAEAEREKLGINRIGPHPWWKRLFGSGESAPASLILTYAGDRREQQRRWRPVENRVKEMQRARARLGLHKILLGFRDGKEFLSIRQITPEGISRFHRLNGLSREIYLFCLDVRTVEEVMKRAGGRIKLEQLGQFVQGMVSRRLMFSDGKRILSLAVQDSGQPEA